MRRVIQIGVVAALLSMSALQAQQAPTLGFRYDFPANSAPRALATADFNRDGFPDLALSGTGRDSILVLFHHGLEDGDEKQRFRPGPEIVVGGGPFDLDVGDINRDGWPDIAVANADLDAVTLILGGVNGAFKPKVDIPMAGNPRGIALADINRDGALDIVVTRYLAARVTILLGRGDGTFAPTGTSYQTSGNPQGVAAGDMDLDGTPDLVVASAGPGGVVDIFAMKPGGVVRADWAQGQPSGWNVVTLGDFDNNGWRDFAVASTASSVVNVFLNHANLAFSFGGLVSVGSSPRGIETADLNQDGVPEIITAGRGSSAVSVLSRGGDGRYGVTHTPAGDGARDVAIADFNGDGRPDVATANESGNSTTILYNATQLVTPGYAFEPIALPFQYDNSSYAIADFNHNGKMDIVRKNTVLLDGTTPSRPLVTLGNGVTDGGAAGDFNGDGHPDVVYAHWNTLWVFFGDGRGDFLTAAVINTGWYPRQLLAADMNRDGRLDIVAAMGLGGSDNAAVEIWLGDGHGHFTKSYHADTGRIPALAVADVDRDGALDMVVSSDLGVSVLTGDGRGGQKGAVPFGTGTPRYGIALGYLNYDGALDLVVADGEHGPYGPQWTTRITVALGRGDGSFEELETYDVGDPGQYDRNTNVVLGDLNHDGFLDVFTGNGVLLLGSTDGRLGEPQRFGVYAWREAIIADVTGDGLNDVIGFTTNHDYSQIIMRNTRRTPAENRAPVGMDLPARGERAYVDFFGDEDDWSISAGPVYDPDLHALRFRWTTGDGRVLSTYPFVYPNLGTGTHQLTLTVDDYRGKVVSDTMEFTITPHKETVYHAHGARLAGSWQKIADSTAAGGYRAYNPNANAPKVNAPLAEPVDYIEFPFLADKTQEYKLWIRLKADGDHWSNDSVWVQFTGAKDPTGNPLYERGSTSGLAVNLEECSGCGISGWGWEDDGWGAVNRNGVTLRFPEGGLQWIRIQTREDGVSIDQVVLSSEKYKATRPGAAKNDTTKLARSGPLLEDW